MRIPRWQKEVYNLYKGQISNAFMLTGNIGDYAYETILLKDFLREFLLNNISNTNWSDGNFKLKDVIIYDINTNGVSANNSRYSLGEIVSMMNDSTVGRAFIFYYPEYIIPAGDYSGAAEKRDIVAIHSAINSSNFVNSANIAFFITESTANIHPMFLGNNSRISLINIELPDATQREEFIRHWCYKHSEEFINASFDFDFDRVANLTAGLQYISIEDILLEAINYDYLSDNMILSKKKEIIKKEFGEIVEILDTEGLSLSKFAGQENIKQYFKEVVINPMKSGETDIIPKGVMLMGPPGTGKTYFAKCLAADSGINFVEFKMSKILGKYVGESEKAMEKALSVFRALAPCGVFIDEIDQTMSRGQGGSDGGSQVNANIFGMVLSEMSKPSNRGKILWFAATNYPNNVDEALKRPGRFDKKIPFFAPTKEERVGVFEMHLKKDESLPKASDVDVDVLAEKTEGYTQAEIEAIVVKARELAKRKKLDAINQDTLLLALDYMLSNQNEKIREMEDIALKECNDQEFIPAAYKERHRSLLANTNANNTFATVDRYGNSR